jgi:hypothetical protein
MAEVSMSYKGRQIVLDTAPDNPTLRIDGQPISLRRNSDGTLWTPRFAFETFRTLEDLARAIIDRAPG